MRSAIEGRPEFIEADRGDHIIFNYLVNFENTFPPVKDRDDETSAILRECRGLIFDSTTHAVISRRYHKFFNLNEREETLAENIDWSVPFRVLEKLDGSFVTMFKTSRSQKIRIGTKMGETDVAKNAEDFLSSRRNYYNFGSHFIARGYTPIFEWCSRKNRIVIDYPVDRLVLTAIRDNLYGEYLQRDKLVEAAKEFGIEYVPALLENITVSDLLEHTKTLEGSEGYVIRFDNGHMLKVKGEWYCQLHKTMEHIQQEKDLIRLILDEKLDDAKPFLAVDLREKLDHFGAELFSNTRKLSREFATSCIEDYSRVSSKKEYAALVIKKDESGLRFKVFDFIASHGNLSIDETSNFVYDLFIDKINNNLATSTKVDSVRHLFGDIRWKL